MWANWINVILGIWLIIASFINNLPYWHLIIIGILVIIFAILPIFQKK